jgi:tetratricopeptide (TPR) repeat protein
MLNEGAEAYRELVDLHRRIFGEASVPSLRMAVHAAHSLSSVGMHDEARDLVTRALAASREEIERESASAAQLDTHAWLLLHCTPEDMRDPVAALPAAKKAVALTGGENPTFLNTLALAYHRSGDHGLALETQRKAEDALREGDLDLRWEVETQMAEFLLVENRAAEAEALLEELVALMREELGEWIMLLGWRESEAALLLVEKNRYELAQRLAESSLEDFRRGMWEGHFWGARNAQAVLGHCLAQGGRHDEGEAQLLEGFEHLRGNPLTPAEYKKRALEWIVQLYEDWGRQQEAARWRAELAAFPRK